MELTSIWENMAGRNPLFLAASASVALGIALVLAAGIIQMRRLRAGDPAPEPHVAGTPAAIGEPAAAASPEIHQPTENPELTHLLARLRSAADRLEEYRARGAGHRPSGPDSPLKRSPSGVDYIVRAGTG